MPRSTWKSVVLAGVAISLVASRAWADPVSLTGAYSHYESQAIRDAESDLHTTIDLLPEGKTIERIDFVRLDPVDRHDPFPAAINALHTTTRERLIGREILVHPGDPYKQLLVDESARNLRLLPQLSLVLCVPMRGKSSDGVRLVVITKDVWSLYVDFDVQATSGGLELLELEPKEINVAGLRHTALARFIYKPRSYSLGATYKVPRLDGRWLELIADANVIVHRDSGTPEGSYGGVTVTRPLYSAHTEWAWSAGVTWTDQIARRYVNADVAMFVPTSGLRPVPWLWRERTLVEQVRVTRSFGWDVKNDFTLGGSFARSRYDVPADGSTDPAAITQFARAAVPIGEDRVGPFVQWHGYTSDFLRILDFDTLGLQEDARLGHDLWVRAYPVLRALGSTRDLVGIYAAAAYGVPLGDGLARASVESTFEVTPDAIADASIRGGLGVVTPRFVIGRLVFTVTALNRWRNYLNAQSFLGGESLLRGYPSRYLAGKDMFAANLEFRSRPVTIASMQFGAAAFYDVGDAFDGFDQVHPKHSLGIGLRAVFPQIDRAVLRFDVGFPISAGRLPSDVAPVSFFVSFNQAVLLPAVGAGRGP